MLIGLLVAVAMPYLNADRMDSQQHILQEFSNNACQRSQACINYAANDDAVRTIDPESISDTLPVSMARTLS